MKKDKRIDLRVSSEEKDLLIKMAKEKEISVSELLLSVLKKGDEK